MNHDEIQSLLGAYALDAVDEEEGGVVELHLRDCPRCRAEVAAHRETAALLAGTGAEAPAGVWEKITGELFGGPAPRARPGTLRPRRVPVMVRLGAALAAAAAAAVAVLGVATVRLEHRVTTLHTAVLASGAAQAAMAALLDPLHRQVHLTSADGRLSAEVAVRLTGDAYVVGTDLPVLDRGRTYQMWGLADSRVVSLGVLGATPMFAAFRVEESVSRLMVTAEPEGGVAAPDSAVLIQGPVSLRG